MKGIFLFSILLSSLCSFAGELGKMDDILGIPEVSQREYLHSSVLAHSHIQTYGMYTCVGLVIYSEKAKEGILAHVDAATNVEKEIPKLLKQIPEISKISLIGGTHKLATKIKEIVEQNNHRVFERIEKVENIILSLESGEIFEYDESFTTTPYAVMDAKLDRMHFGGKRLFRHMDSLGGGDYLEVSEKPSTPFGFNSIF
jgi:hypothetical protein